MSRGEESDGVLSIEVESRGQLCATGTASLPVIGAVALDRGFPANRRRCRNASR